MLLLQQSVQNNSEPNGKTNRVNNQTKTPAEKTNRWNPRERAEETGDRGLENLVVPTNTAIHRDQTGQLKLRTTTGGGGPADAHVPSTFRFIDSATAASLPRHAYLCLTSLNPHPAKRNTSTPRRSNVHVWLLSPLRGNCPPSPVASHLHKEFKYMLRPREQSSVA